MIGAQARHLDDLRVWDFSQCDVVVPWPWNFAGGGDGGRRRMDLGTINAVSADQPRIDYSSSGGLGLMIEGERITKTAGGETPALAGAGGSYSTDGLASLLADPGVLGPTGQPMGHLVRANSAGYGYTPTVVDFVAGQLTGRSVFLRRGTTGLGAPHVMATMFVFGPGGFATAYIDLDAGVIQNVTAGGAELIDWGGGLYELLQWGTPGASAAGLVDINIISSSDGHGHYFGCDCVVAGRPTTFFSGTKPAESLSDSAAAFDLDGDAWTVIVTAQEPYSDPTPGYPMLLHIAGAGGSVISINKQPDGSIAFEAYDGTTPLQLTRAAGTPGVMRKYALGISRAAGVMRAGATGAGVVDLTGASLTTFPALTTVRAGSAAGNGHIDGIVQKVATVPRLLSASEILMEIAT